MGVVTGEGGRIRVGHDEEGRAVVTNLPPTLPGLFDAFCALHAETIAVIAGGERLAFAELNEEATRPAHALASGFGIHKGDRVAIAMRNAPSWIVCYMAVLKAGAVAALVNGWWQADELRHALELTEPKLVIADTPRAQRIEATGLDLQTVTLPIERPLHEALAPILDRKSTRLNPVTNAHLVCRLLLEKKKSIHQQQHQDNITTTNNK